VLDAARIQSSKPVALNIKRICRPTRGVCVCVYVCVCVCACVTNQIRAILFDAQHNQPQTPTRLDSRGALPLQCPSALARKNIDTSSVSSSLDHG
jgi:hypothetical protein